MCPIYILCLTATVSRFFSTGAGGTMIFCCGEIERKSVTRVFPGIGWKMNFNLLLS